MQNTTCPYCNLNLKLKSFNMPVLPIMKEIEEEALLKNNTVNYELGFIHGANAMYINIIELLNK